MTDEIFKKLHTDMAKVFTISLKEVRGDNFILLPQYYEKKKAIEKSRKGLSVQSERNRLHSLSKDKQDKWSCDTSY